MPTNQTDREPTIRRLLQSITDHLQGLSEGEWTRAQNDARQIISGDGIMVELTFRTDEARSRELAAIGASISKPSTKGNTRDIQAEVAAANANQPGRTSGIPLGTAPKKGFSAPEVKHFENAETREYK